MHQTAILFAPLAFLLNDKPNWIIAGLAMMVFILVGTFLFRDASFYSNAYILQDYGAVGAGPRVAFNVVAAAVFGLFLRRWSAQYDDFRLYLIMAFAVVVITPFVPYYQVAVDRLEYYLVPFQLAVVARVPALLPHRYRMMIISLIYAGYAAALGIWMNYSDLVH